MRQANYYCYMTLKAWSQLSPQTGFMVIHLPCYHKLKHRWREAACPLCPWLGKRQGRGQLERLIFPYRGTWSCFLAIHFHELSRFVTGDQSLCYSLSSFHQLTERRKAGSLEKETEAISCGLRFYRWKTGACLSCSEVADWLAEGGRRRGDLSKNIPHTFSSAGSAFRSPCSVSNVTRLLCLYSVRHAVMNVSCSKFHFEFTFCSG